MFPRFTIIPPSTPSPPSAIKLESPLRIISPPSYGSILSVLRKIISFAVIAKVSAVITVLDLRIQAQAKANTTANTS